MGVETIVSGVSWTAGVLIWIGLGYEMGVAEAGTGKDGVTPPPEQAEAMIGTKASLRTKRFMRTLFPLQRGLVLYR